MTSKERGSDAIPSSSCIYRPGRLSAKHLTYSKVLQPIYNRLATSLRQVRAEHGFLWAELGNLVWKEKLKLSQHPPQQHHFNSTKATNTINHPTHVKMALSCRKEAHILHMPPALPLTKDHMTPPCEQYCQWCRHTVPK